MNNQAVTGGRLVTNYFLLSGGELVGKIFTIVAFAYLARVLGPETFGNLEFALAIIFFFSLLVDCGLSPYGAREIAKNEDVASQLVGHIVLIRLVTAFIAFSLLAILVFFIDKPWPIRSLILFYGLTLFALPGLMQWVFQGRDRMHHVAVSSILRWSVFTGGVLLFIRGSVDIWLLPLIEGFAIVCVVVYHFRVLSRGFTFLGKHIRYSSSLSILRQSSPIGASQIFWALKVYFATVFLGVIIGGPEVGWFGAAHRIVIALHAFVWLYFFNLLPSISRATQGPLDAFSRLTKTSLQLTAWLAVLIGTMGTVFAGMGMGLIYGPEYGEAIPIFRILIWLIPLGLMSGHFRCALIASNRQNLEFRTTAWGGIFNVLLNLLLLPHYGVFGAAFALLGSEALIWRLSYRLVSRSIVEIRIWSSISKPLAVGVVIMIVLHMLPPTNIWLAFTSVVLLYSLALLITKPGIFFFVRSFLANRHEIAQP